MGIEQIKEKILESANRDAGEVLEKGRAENQIKVQEAKSVATRNIEAGKERARADAEILKLRRESAGNLEAKKMRLVAKQDVISSCFKAAEEKLANLSQDEYMAFLRKKLEQTGASGGELVFNEKDGKSVGSAIVSELNAKGGNFTLAEDTLDASGGFMLRMGPVEMDLSFGMLLKTIREEITPKVVEVLFS